MKLEWQGYTAISAYGIVCQKTIFTVQCIMSKDFYYAHRLYIRTKPLTDPGSSNPQQRSSDARKQFIPQANCPQAITSTSCTPQHPFHHIRRHDASLQMHPRCCPNFNILPKESPSRFEWGCQGSQLDTIMDGRCCEQLSSTTNCCPWPCPV